jgi:hypothetical protein
MNALLPAVSPLNVQGTSNVKKSERVHGGKKEGTPKRPLQTLTTKRLIQAAQPLRELSWSDAVIR